MKRETKAQREERVARILGLLDQEYGTEYRCYLNHETPWQLLIAVLERPVYRRQVESGVGEAV